MLRQFRVLDPNELGAINLTIHVRLTAILLFITTSTLTTLPTSKQLPCQKVQHQQTRMKQIHLFRFKVDRQITMEY